MHSILFPGLNWTLLVSFFWTNILTKASPLPTISPDFESLPEQIVHLNGPLVCYRNLTIGEFGQQGSLLSCDAGTYCQGITTCNDTLVCSQDWIDLNGTLACNGELFCNGTLRCNKGPVHPACLPGLGILPPLALSILIVFLIIISGGLSGLKSAFMGNPSLLSSRKTSFIY